MSTRTGSHPTPRWFTDAKLGYFIHWGAYSVPAFASKPDGKSYAEWYWYEYNQVGSHTFERHRDKYGADFRYDQFLEQWRPDRFDPHAWLDLFTRGGAEYFVPVSKHHDGIALWGTETTGRNTVDLGPRRDLMAELFDAAADYPLKKGVYFSMPEWYHPLGGWAGRGPSNPYTGEPEPYTGYQPVADYVRDHQYPQMLELVERFDPDLFWCD